LPRTPLRSARVPLKLSSFSNSSWLILVGRLLGETFIRLGQSAVTGQLIAGILLGPSALGVLWPEARHYLFPDAEEQRAMLNAVSQVGILLLLLLTGMDTRLRLVRRAGFAAASISVTGIVVPFALGFALGEVLPESVIPKPELRFVTSLFLGAVLAISSIKIVAIVDGALSEISSACCLPPTTAQTVNSPHASAVSWPERSRAGDRAPGGPARSAGEEAASDDHRNRHGNP
jgi:Kef-type K+ transport system membrane component KefB